MPPALKLHIDVLFRLYNYHLSFREIGELFNTGASTIHNLFIKYKLETRRVGWNPPRLERSPIWKGDDVTYAGAHKRLPIILGSPSKCEMCGTTSNLNRYEWANLSGKFTDPADYKRVCKKCHRTIDKHRYGPPAHTIYIEHDGCRKTITELATEHNMTHMALYGRLKRGWSLDEALSIPMSKTHHISR